MQKDRWNVSEFQTAVFLPEASYFKWGNKAAETYKLK